MEFEFVSTHPPDVVRFAMYFLLPYPFFVWLLSGFRPAGSGPMSASVVPATLTPLFMGSAMAAVMIANVLQARSFGLSPFVAASNAAESTIGLGIGAMFAAFVSAMALAGDWFSRASHDPLEPGNAPRVRDLCVLLVGIFGLTIVANVVFMRMIVAEDARFSATLPIATAIISLAGAIVSFTWLIASRRIVGLQFNRTRRTIAATCTVASLALLVMTWGIIKAMM